MKICSICKQNKEESDFGSYIYKTTIKLKAHCRECYNQIRHRSWMRHRDKHLLKAKQFRTTHPEICSQRARKSYQKNRNNNIERNKKYRSTLEGKIQQWKYGAKRRKIEWRVTDAFLKKLPMICHYSGIPLTLEIGNLNTISIDRVDSDKPYENSNIVPTCSIINMMKGELSTKDFLEICQKISAYYTRKV